MPAGGMGRMALLVQEVGADMVGIATEGRQMAGGTGGLGRVEIGAVFGLWTVLGVSSLQRREVYYDCRCSCGTEKPVAKSSLLRGASTRCRKCSNADNQKARVARRRPIRPGTIIGLWTVLGEAEARGGNLYMLCRCACGAEHKVMVSTLRHGKSKSCASCSRKMGLKKNREMTAKYGGVRAEYRAWSRMLDRCRNPNDGSFERYGGRGIKVCEEWQGNGGFERFIKCVGPRPSKRHSLERIDNSGDYRPSNVKWVTGKDQARNRRTNRILTIDGVAKCVAEWGEEEGVSASTISGRLSRGWSDKEAVMGRHR